LGGDRHGAAPGQFTFELTGRQGASYELQSSPDLNTWTSWRTTSITNSSVQVSDVPAPAADRRFYRALSH
jgi:hypothetical protein